MLIQIFTNGKDETERALTMVYNEYKPSFIEYSVMRDIQEGFYIMEPYENLNEVVRAMSNIVDESKDNIGIYYMGKDKIFLRVFQGAKNAGVEYLYEDEKERLRQKQREVNGKSS